MRNFKKQFSVHPIIIFRFYIIYSLLFLLLCNCNSIVLFCLQIAVGILFLCCDRVLRESQKVTKYCYQIQEEIDSGTKHDMDSLKKLCRLIRFMEQCDVKFTAVNFFTINRGTILGIINIVTTYLIVIMQFNGISYE